MCPLFAVPAFVLFVVLSQTLQEERAEPLPLTFFG